MLNKIKEPPASTLDEGLRQASQDDEFLPSRGVRCQYSPSGEEAEKNSLLEGATRCLDASQHHHNNQRIWDRKTIRSSPTWLVPRS